MKIASTFSGGALRLLLSGELDHHAAGCVMSAVEHEIDVYLPRDCILDLTELSFMDSSGIAVMLKTLRRMNEIGGRVRIVGVRKQPMRVIDASGIERIIAITAAVG